MQKQYDKTMNDKLFSVDRFKEGDEYERELEKAHELSIEAKSLILEFGDQVVFDNWHDYLKESVHSRIKARNFMISFFDYNGHELKVKDPYPFLGLLFNRLNLSLDADPSEGDEETMLDTFDTIYVSILISSGIIKEDDYFYVNLYTDKRFKKAVKENK